MQVIPERVRTIVIGSGCAGLNAADTLAALGETDLLLITEDMNAGTSRNTGSDKQTYYKLSLAGDEPDSVGELARTLTYPDVHADTALCEAAGSVESFFKLCRLGVPFPTNDYGEYVGYQTDHDTRRRATSVGPLTSKVMTEALEASIRQRGVPVLNALAVRIETDAGNVRSLLVYLPDDNRFTRIVCANILLCTGGPAHIYEDRVYPESQHGMSSLAFEAGAAGANLDCWQYGLASVDFRWNLSGSYQQVIPRYLSTDPDGTEHAFLEEALGTRRTIYLTFLKGYQWPYDVGKVPGSSQVDCLVKQELDKGRRVWLDYRVNPDGFRIENLPDEVKTYLINCGALGSFPIERLIEMNEPAVELYRNHGIDLSRERLEIRVCAQHHNGGIAVDANWQTSVKGLYVCGEAAGTFGRKRPGGSALNATQVGSMRAARHVRQNGREAAKIRPLDNLDPVFMHYEGENAADYQHEMTKHAAFLRDMAGMQALFLHCNQALDSGIRITSREARDRSPKEILSDLFLHDILVTQREVLSAMLFAGQETGEPEGILETRRGISSRIPQRPAKNRDLWFERVWKASREGLPDKTGTPDKR